MPDSSCQDEKQTDNRIGSYRTLEQQRRGSNFRHPPFFVASYAKTWTEDKRTLWALT
ncbi:hypothetical protein L798_12730 [Zootermopsis nevadensis]|uniref:Uncharacterized protein n=1 Tax=Zootermopsis nevadensis TaxID=136037 RepID=A0A067RPQ1_ZOONE|nr:hypothetical protein L798_12730 [Zootermopsis nevadensis]